MRRGSYSYSLLEVRDLVIGQGVSLGNDGDQVNLAVQLLHDFNVKRLEGMSSGLDEVNAGVDAVIHDVHPVDLVLGVEIGIESLFNILDDRVPGLVVIDEVTKTRGVNNGQTEANTVFLNISADGLDRDGLRDIEAWWLALLGWV